MIELTDEQLAKLAELIADRLAERASTAPRLVTAGELADRLSVARSFVYEHRDELGAIRLGDGPKAPLRFDVDVAKRAMSCSADGRSQDRIVSDDGGSEPSSPERRRRLPDRLPKPGSVLTVRGGS